MTPRLIGRRRFLAAAAAPLLPALGGCTRPDPWEAGAFRRTERSRVAVLAAADYARPLADTIVQGLRQFSLDLPGKTVVLKPNLVEYDPAGVINTHPAVIAGAVEAFRRLGARRVVVAEGPGHRRDSEYLVTASGLHALLRDLRAPYVDLNHDDTRPLALGSHFTRLTELHLPKTVLEADLLVSMPKLKTHHWAGVTLSLKNLFGIVPGLVYGWPKNVLHWAGIHESVCDINSTIPVPRFAIVDGIVGMEGNGPIQGDAKPAGVLVLGDDLVAVDATAARLMGVAPHKVKYIEQAGRFLGNADPERIEQVGEPVERLRKEFRVIESFQHLRQISG